jgi:YidC/Oxa1 family membrane protein insertase
MFDLLAGLIDFFYSLVPSYVFAISMLTVTVMVVLAPLTIKSTRSMLALQRLQPAIKKLQAEHKGDRQALNEAMMAFYKEHKINPLGGCLPMLLQMPVFIIMYRVIDGLRTDPPRYLKEGQELYDALVGKGFSEWGIDLGKTATGIKGGFADAFPYYVLVGLVVLTGWYQARQMSSRQTAQANPQAQMMQRIFPIFFGLISLSIPAGVVVYFVVSNLFRIIQQALMYRYDPQLASAVKAEIKEVEAKATELKKGGGQKGSTQKGSTQKGSSQQGRAQKAGGPQPRSQGNRNRSRSRNRSGSGRRRGR